MTSDIRVRELAREVASQEVSRFVRLLELELSSLLHASAGPVTASELHWSVSTAHLKFRAAQERGGVQVSKALGSLDLGGRTVDLDLLVASLRTVRDSGSYCQIAAEVIPQLVNRGRGR